jgi:hypothetical protein
LRRELFARLQRIGSTIMLRLGPGPALLAAACFAALACYAVPPGLDAYRQFIAADDPSALADRALDKSFDPATARAGIEDALAAKDADLAHSFVSLARERHVPLDPALTARVDEAVREASSTRHAAESFALGLVTGEPTDGASLAGTATGDLFLFGDIRDAVREGTRLATGQQADELVLGLAGVGIAVTAGTYATFGSTAPIRAGLTLAKAARKAGRLGAGLAGATGRLLREAVDFAQFKRAASALSSADAGAAIRAARQAVKFERAGKLVDLTRDISKVQTKAGTRAALDGLALAETPRQVGRLAKLAEKEGSRTRAILKVLGRGAIMLAGAAIDLMVAIMTAAFAVISFVWSLKRGAERMTEQYLRRKKERRLRRFHALTMRLAHS